MVHNETEGEFQSKRRNVLYECKCGFGQQLNSLVRIPGGSKMATAFASSETTITVTTQ
jgi:hypothetical protein